MSQTVQERQASKIALLDRQLYVANDRAECESSSRYGIDPRINATVDVLIVLKTNNSLRT